MSQKAESTDVYVGVGERARLLGDVWVCTTAGRSTCGTPLSENERGGGVRSTLLLLGGPIPAGKEEDMAVMKSSPFSDGPPKHIK